VSVTTDSKHVTVRMYNVGFGDAFLLVFPAPDRPRTVLIDIGTHTSGQGPRPVSAVARDVIADVTGDDGVARIDVVVGTHRHQDHVSGFEQPDWSAVEVGEVWMPWTEDPDDPEATRIRELQSRAATHLCAGLERLGARAAPGALELAQNNLTNRRAMETLHTGFAGNPKRRFLPREDRVAVMTSEFLPGVRIHVLGPSRDPDVIRDMNPPAGESYLRLLGTSEEDGSAKPPFTAGWELTPDDVAADEHYAHLALEPRDVRILKDLADDDALALAVQLEKSVNGTSLMLMFEVGEALLMFPGDAQWGSWQRLLKDEDAQALIERTTFLKVGHHGSHNATPKDFVEALQRQHDARPESPLWAMVSTHPVKRWPSIPKAELLAALGELTPQLARSDEAAAASASAFSHADEAFVEARVPTG
jgi:beta-lactamase superfamily II metal-dependent hydrolase